MPSTDWLSKQLRMTDQGGNVVNKTIDDALTELKNHMAQKIGASQPVPADLQAAQNSANACMGHSAAPPGTGSWPDCQNVGQHKNYVRTAWSQVFGQNAPSQPDWATIKNAMDHTGEGVTPPSGG